VSPVAGGSVSTTNATTPIVVSFSASARSTLSILTNGVVAASWVVPSNTTSGTHTFNLNVSAYSSTVAVLSIQVQISTPSYYCGTTSSLGWNCDGWGWNYYGSTYGYCNHGWYGGCWGDDDDDDDDAPSTPTCPPTIVSSLLATVFAGAGTSTGNR